MCAHRSSQSKRIAPKQTATARIAKRGRKRAIAESSGIFLSDAEVPAPPLARGRPATMEKGGSKAPGGKPNKPEKRRLTPKNNAVDYAHATD